MAQRTITQAEQDTWKPLFESLFREGRVSFGGIPFMSQTKLTLEASEDGRNVLYEHLYRAGSFGFFSPEPTTT